MKKKTRFGTTQKGAPQGGRSGDGLAVLPAPVATVGVVAGGRGATGDAGADQALRGDPAAVMRGVERGTHTNPPCL